MKALLLAPHPFYQDRGTPIAVDLLLTALSEKGVHVDVLTYHEGTDRTYTGPGTVRIFRIKNPPVCKNVRPGFSIKKVIADVYMHAEAKRMAKKESYDVVHAVEESVFMAMRIAKKFKIPYVFDMDSSMPEQIAEKMSFAKPILPIMRSFERAAVKNALAVTAVCDSLGDIAKNYGANKLTLLRDVPLQQEEAVDESATGFRAELGITGTSILYIGNLEKYQGIDLLLNGFAKLPESTGACLVIVGGIAEHIEQYRQQTKDLGIENRAHFIGPRPISHMAALMSDADILVSPRTKGNNTPMKIYSYMASGKAVLATDLFTHTQVLDSDTAMLAKPNAEDFSVAIDKLVSDPTLRASLGQNALKAVEDKYSLRVFKQTVNELYDWIAEQTTHEH